jgi:hypothetical protein
VGTGWRGGSVVDGLVEATVKGVLDGFLDGPLDTDGVLEGTCNSVGVLDGAVGGAVDRDGAFNTNGALVGKYVGQVKVSRSLSLHSNLISRPRYSKMAVLPSAV